MQIAIAFFCSILSIAGAGIYLFLRAGFVTDYISVFKILGISLILLILPVFVNKRLADERKDKWFFNESFQVFILLVVFCLLGFIFREVPVDYAIIIGGFGYILFVWLLIELLKTISILKLVLFLSTIGLLSVFIISVLYSTHVKPIFYEDLAIEELVRWYYWKVDTLFHVANSQMFNTYGIPSSGIDGIPYIPYHYGSNILYTELANFLHIKIFDAYILLPVIVTSSLFLSTFLGLVYHIRKLIKVPDTIDYIFLLMLLAAFVGVVTNRISGNFLGLPSYMSMLLGSPILFVSDSFTLSLIFLNIFIILIIRFYSEYQKGTETKLSTIIFLLIAVPVIYFCIAYLKISTLYIAISLIGYLFLRLKLFKNYLFVVSYSLMVIIGGITYTFTRETKYGDGGISFFYHFIENHQNFFIFLIFQFFWCWVLLFLFSSNKMIGSIKEVINKKELLGVEAVFVLMAASLVPAILIEVPGGKLFYFTEISSWYAVVLILAYIPLFKFENFRYKIVFADIPVSVNLLFRNKVYSMINTVIKSRVIVLFLVTLPLAYVFRNNIWNYGRLMVNINYTSRFAMLTGFEDLPELHRFQLAKIANLDKEVLASIRFPLQSARLNPKVPPAMAFVNKLNALNAIPISEKKQSLVYVNFNNLDIYLPLHCYEKPFLVPALTGMASVHGGMTQACIDENSWFNSFGFEHYEVIDASDVDINQLKKEVTQKGFKWLYYYDKTKAEFTKIDCNS